jgi:hypothetical protein
MNRKAIPVVVLVLLMTVEGAASVATVDSSGDITSQTNTGFELTSKNTTVYPENPFDTSRNDTILMQNGSVRSSGDASAELEGIDMSGNVTLTLTDAQPGVFLEADGRGTVGAEGLADELTVFAGGIDEAKGTLDFGYVSTGSTNITVEGQTPGEFYIIRDVDTGQGLGIATADASGNVTFENVETGNHDVDLSVLIGIEVFSISDDPQLIDNATVEFRLFEEGSDRVFTRSTDDGVISIEDLPTNTAFSVTAKADGFVTRQTFFESARQQQQIFLLNNSSDSDLVRFNIEDRTGLFDQGVRVQIERSLNTSDSPTNQERYVIVGGDIVGGQLSFDTELERNIRYRISVANDQGDSRELGSFLIKTEQAVNLVISGIDVGFVEPGRTQINVTQDISDSGTKTIQFSAVDVDEETTNLQVEIINRETDTVVDSGGTTDTIGSFVFTSVQPNSSDTDFLVRYSYDRDGETVEATVGAGTSEFPLLDELDSGWAQIFGVGFLLIFAGIFSRGNATIGALVIPGVALLLYIIGLLDGVVTVATITFAFAIAIGVTILESDARV